MTGYDWGLNPEAEAWQRAQVLSFLEESVYARTLATQIEQGTSTDFFDWIDHMVIPRERVDASALSKMGFRERALQTDKREVYSVEGTTLPPVVMGEEDTIELAIKPEDLDAFKRALVLGSRVEGDFAAPYRRLVVNEARGHLLCAVERRGTDGLSVRSVNDIEEYLRALEWFATRERGHSSVAEQMSELEAEILDMRKTLEQSRIADAFFRVERRFWQSRNKAGRAQKSRQDVFGLGWGNTDHHTFRSSRSNFASLIRVLKALGLTPRERYYAGAQAGWGAQIMEGPGSRNIVFADVDLGEEERQLDFTREELEEGSERGTVGLWASLHGESILGAGMHHLAARFRFDGLAKDLRAEGIEMMKPFSNFPFLRQAFTKGERWRPRPDSLAGLRSSGLISSDQENYFRTEGAIGSHLENIQRRQGFKGFNQDSVSAIIKATDPRLQMVRGA